MAIVEILAAVSALGFLAASGFALKSYSVNRNATNVWLLTSIGFLLISARYAFTTALYFYSSLGYLEEVARDTELVGFSLIFSAVAVYWKEKRMCSYCDRKKADSKTYTEAKKFADGI